ncbi:MAG: glycosyltransferase family 87 protein [Endozoicomonas sp.]
MLNLFEPRNAFSSALQSRQKLLQLHPAEKLGLGLWGLALLLIAAKVILEPGVHTVVDSYLLGADRWLSRETLYSGPRGFLYMPTFALLFTPFTKITVFWADFIWRLFIFSLYFWAILKMVRALQSASGKSTLNWLGTVSLIAVPIAFSGLRNGQMNVVLIAVMVLVCCQLLEERWNAAALSLALVMSLKPTFIVFFLLATALFRPLWFRVPPMLLGFLALPMLVGGWEYGVQQYLHFVDMARSAAELGISTPKWATLFNVPAQVWGYTVAQDTQNVIKVILAATTWGLCLYTLQRMDRKSALVYLLSLAACYHMMFNPRGVNTDYIILGSVLAFWLATACYLWRDRRLAITTGALSLGVLFAYDMSRLIVPDATSWFNPLMALGFTIVVIRELFRGRSFEGSSALAEEKAL